MYPAQNGTLHTAKLNVLTPDMPPPPAYDMVVDPNAPIPNLHNPYDPLSDDEEKEADDIPEITINAAKQIRGHGNIISMPAMDSTRIAEMLYMMIHGSPPSPRVSQTAAGDSSCAGECRRGRAFPKINVTVNCGTTVIGDRNIVGPGLGDVARYMQSNRSHAQGQHARPGAQGQQAAQGPTPPRSRSSSEGGDGGVKRKAEEDVEGEREVKKTC